MALALMLNAFITSVLIGATPTPCPPGEAPAPIGVVDGAVETACRPIEATRASSDEAARYAAKEKASPKAADFRGGDAVIFVSGGALIVLIVLLILLI